jgi:hypothetical protein
MDSINAPSSGPRSERSPMDFLLTLGGAVTYPATGAPPGSFLPDLISS